MIWKPIETAPTDGTHILLRYYKGGSNWRTRTTKVYGVTEGYMAHNCAWVDFLDRLIVQVNTKSPKNFITHWMPLPKDPEN